MLVYAVVSAKTEKAIETFVRREDAERFLEEVRHDDAELAERLRASRSSSRPNRFAPTLRSRRGIERVAFSTTAAREREVGSQLEEAE